MKDLERSAFQGNGETLKWLNLPKRNAPSAASPWWKSSNPSAPGAAPILTSTAGSPATTSSPPGTTSPCLTRTARTRPNLHLERYPNLPGIPVPAQLSLWGEIAPPGHRAVAERGRGGCCLRGTGTIVVTRQSVGDPVTHPSSRPAIPFIHIAFSRLRGKIGSPIRPVAHGPAPLKPDAQIAQLVEQRIENPRVAGSIPALGTTILPRNSDT